MTPPLGQVPRTAEPATAAGRCGGPDLLGHSTILTDFGKGQAAEPCIIQSPRTARDLAVALGQDPRPAALRIRGLAHSVDGQTVTSGTVVRTSGLTQIEPVGPRAVRVGAGATWREVSAHSLSSGLIPPVMVDYLDLTVGGTLSMGGVSGMSHRYGTQADHVLRATVVDRDGSVYDCGRGDRLLDRVLCGQGAHGALADVTLRLVEAPPSMLVWSPQRGNPFDLLALQERLLRSYGRVHLDGRGHQVGTPEERWTATVALPNTGRAAVHRDAITDTTGVAPVTVPFPMFVDRATAAIRQDQSSGSWAANAHPRLQLITPLAATTSDLSSFLEHVSPSTMGSGDLLLYATRARALKRLRVRGDAHGLACLIGYQRSIPAAATDQLHHAWTENHRLRALAHTIGGTCYAGPPLGWSRPLPTAWVESRQTEEHP